MKKLREEYFFRQRFIPKILRIMKLYVLFMLVCAIHVSAASYSQSTKIDLKLEDASLRDVMRQIKRVSEFSFLYYNEDVKTVEGLNLNIKKGRVDDILKECLRGTDLEYEIDDKVIVIKKRPIEEILDGEAPKEDKKEIKGKVVDEGGFPLPGVAIQVKGTTMGTATQLDGSFELSVPKNAILVFSFIGFDKQEIKADKEILNVTLIEAVEGLEEVVVVGYGTQKRISVTGAVSTIQQEVIEKSPTMDIATALTGKLPGLVVVENSGLAGSGAAKINIRGKGTSNDSSPLILVDGIERDFQELDMDEIANVSILKDASATAVYGIRGANGVIIVTTKRGNVGKPKISFKANYGLVFPGKLPELLDSSQYASLKNEGKHNDEGYSFDADGNFIGSYSDEYLKSLEENGDPRADNYEYSYTDIELFKNGTSPYTHPSEDFYDWATNDYGTQQRYTLNMTGGTEKLRYFVSTGYSRERDIFRDFDVGYDDRSYYARYNVRSNLDFDLTKTTEFSIDLAGQFAKRHQPNDNIGALVYNMFQTPPDAYSGIVDGKITRPYNGNNAHITHESVYAGLYDNGYTHNSSNKVQFSLQLKQKLDFITKGLSFKAKVAYDNGHSSKQTASKNVPIYYIDVKEDGSLAFYQYQKETKLGNSRSFSINSKKVNIRTALNYSREFSGGHNVSGMAVFNASERSLHGSDPQYVPFKYLEYASRLSYNYKFKYFIEGNFGLNGSENFAKSNRYGFFPAVSAGWVVTKEKFIPKNNILSFLKLRGSFGYSGNDKGVRRFYYFDVMTLSSGGYRFGMSPATQGSAGEKAIGNKDVSWEKNEQQNYAVETKWFDSRLSVDGEFFFYHRTDILAQQQSLPTIVAAPLPNANIKVIDNKGYEITASWKDKIGKVDYYVRGNYNYSKNKLVFIDEVPQKYPWMAKTGNSIDQVEGLVFDGFYTQDEINRLSDIQDGSERQEGDPVASGYTAKLQAGDLKYKDLNGDNIIDKYDVQWFDNTSLPKTTFGFGTGFSWKGLSVDVMFQGVTDVTYNINGRFRYPFFNGFNNGSELMLNRWTPERFANGEVIEHPRMTASSSTANHNYKTSDFWFRDASYIRLKNAEISYRFKGQKLKDKGISSIRVFMNGTNLYTWSDLKLVDPETKSGDSAAIPPNKVFNLGVQMTF
ncbi:SusC/RagA family TonB-linked outer membrane protein [Puteibacter caeruleilacunae]|nr:SusC/RagA family TonB-linked outer membrane protein [Puteibacter caeruleilacunae]